MSLIATGAALYIACAVQAKAACAFVDVNDAQAQQIQAHATIGDVREQVIMSADIEPYTAFEEPYTEYQQTGGEIYAYDMPTSGLTQQGGVNYHDGRTETWYSSNTLYHYRTPEWTVDAEGFYRTQDGYYVVAASDIEQGALLETSKGTAQVLDSGCDAGVTDFYCAW